MQYRNRAALSHPQLGRKVVERLGQFVGIVLVFILIFLAFCMTENVDVYNLIKLGLIPLSVVAIFLCFDTHALLKTTEESKEGTAILGEAVHAALQEEKKSKRA